MESLIAQVSSTDISGFAEHFSEHQQLRACLDAVLEGRLGTLWSGANAVRADVGCYAFFGGDATTPQAHALAHRVTVPRELLWGADRAWETLLREIWAERLLDRPMRHFDASGLSLGHLESLAATMPEGYEIVPFDVPLAEQLDDDLHPHALKVFPSTRAFIEQGLGYGATKAGALACAATSYTIASGRIELAIATHPEHRRRGLATSTAAALAAACLRRGLVPEWNAANETSERLAARLGYQRAGLVEILYVQ